MTSDEQEGRRREDVDPADALGGAGGLPPPGGQPRGTVPTERDEPGGESAPESVLDRDEQQAER